MRDSVLFFQFVFNCEKSEKNCNNLDANVYWSVHQFSPHWYVSTTTRRTKRGNHIVRIQPCLDKIITPVQLGTVGHFSLPVSFLFFARSLLTFINSIQSANTRSHELVQVHFSTILKHFHQPLLVIY